MAATPVCPAGCTVPCRFAFAVGGFEVYRCEGCGLYLLHGAPQRHDLTLDRTQFEEAFRTLRLRNYARILDAVGRQVPLNEARLLDVGSSNGWFLAAAAGRGCRAFGIEPDPFFCQRARATLPPSVEVVEGYFPGDLPAGWGPFDVITFHDVFEHLDDPQGTLRACRERLKARGVVVLSVPSARGFVYRLGCLFNRLGWKAPLERSFQVNYPFPHLFYFTPASLERLAAIAGFEVVARGRVDGFAVRGALSRARLDDPGGSGVAIGQYATALGLVGIALLQRLLPADNVYAVLRTRDA